MLKLHHINLASHRVPEMDAFYRGLLGLEPVAGMSDEQRVGPPRPQRARLVGDGTVQLHLSPRDAGVGFEHGHALNPLDRGHIAFRTDDVEAVKERLRRAGVPFSDYGCWANKDWYQIFFQDPNGNLVEIHQVMGD